MNAQSLGIHKINCGFRDTSDHPNVTWFYLALRNLLRNARRSVTTIAAVGLGYSAINVLAGFTSYMFASIEDADIYEEVNGHVQIWKKGARDYGGPDYGDYLIEPPLSPALRWGGCGMDDTLSSYTQALHQLRV